MGLSGYLRVRKATLQLQRWHLRTRGTSILMEFGGARDGPKANGRRITLRRIDLVLLPALDTIRLRPPLAGPEVMEVARRRISSSGRTSTISMGIPFGRRMYLMTMMYSLSVNRSQLVLSCLLRKQCQL